MHSTRELVQNSVLYGATEVVNRFIVFALLPILTAYLAPADFGINGIVLSTSVFLTPVISLGMGAGIAPCYFDSESERHRNATISTAFLILLVSASVFAVLCVSTARFLSVLSFRSERYARFVILGVAATALTVLAIPFRQALQFTRRARLYVALSTLAAIATAGATLAMVVGLNRGIAGLLEANIIAQGVALVLFAAPMLANFGRFEWALARRLLRTSIPLVPAFGSLFVLQHASRYVLQWTDGLSAVGVYTVGQNMGLVVSVIVTGFQSAWIPFFMAYAGRREEARIILGRVTTYFVMGFGAISLCLYAVARPVIMIMTTAPYHEAWRVVGLSATTQFLSGLFIVLLPGMYFADEVQYLGLVQAVAGVVSIVLNVIMIRLWGVVGAALAMMLSYVSLVVFQLAWNRRRRYVDIAYEWARLSRYACLYSAGAVLMLWPRSVRLPIEVALSVLSLAAVAALSYAHLSQDERRAVWVAMTRGSVEAPPGVMFEQLEVPFVSRDTHA